MGKVVKDFIHDLKAIGGTWLTLCLIKETLSRIVTNDTELKQEVLERIERSIKMLNSIYVKQDTINSIAYSKYKIEPEIINICDMSNHILNYLHFTYYLKDIKVIKEFPAELLIQAVPFEVVQAIENIVKNAIEAMQNSLEKVLSVKICNEDENVKIIEAVP